MAVVYEEQLIKKKKNISGLLIKAGGIMIVLTISFLAVLFTPEFSLYVMIVLGLLYYLLLTRLRVGYEYVLKDGSLNINMIYNGVERKELLSLDLADISVFLPVAESAGAPELALGKALDCSSGEISDRSYVFPAVMNGKRIKVVMEPNEKLLAAMAQFIGRGNL